MISDKHLRQRIEEVLTVHDVGVKEDLVEDLMDVLKVARKQTYRAEDEYLPFTTSLFNRAWVAWCADRRDRRKPLTQRAAQLQLRELLHMGEHEAVEALNTAIANGWQKPYPPKGTSSVRSRTAAEYFGYQE